VAAVVEQKGYPIDMLDLSGIANHTDVVSDYIAAHETSTFCLTATTPQMPAVISIAKTIRRLRPEARIVLGGPHVTLVNAAQRQELARSENGRATRAMDSLRRHFTTLVAGDGEEAVFLALRPNAAPLIDADRPESPLFLSSKRLTELPLPARHLVAAESYRYFIDDERAMSLIAQLGCPFACGFCGGRKSPSLRRIRTRSKDAVLGEMRHLYQTYGVKGFMLYDDELNVNRGMIELMDGICDLQSELGADFRLRGFIKAELFDEAQAKAMFRAGFRWILTGFESGSPRILRNINKKATREDNTRCVELARMHGLKTKALMSVGHPGESHQSLAQTLDWLLQTRPDDFDVTIITTYPGTPYYDDARPHPSLSNVFTYECHGDRLHAYEVDYNEVADYYKGDPNGGYRSFVFTDELSCEDIVQGRDRIEREVRAKLGIAFNASRAASQYEHSMGQRGFPASVLRRTARATERAPA
jgi:anaerobic magnesium-protoporphyrin IX monomethyl ester cyclase